MNAYVSSLKQRLGRAGASDAALTMRLLILAATLIALTVVFFVIARPWYLNWGATPEETRKVLPGDDIIPNAVGQSTRAMTIGAPIEAVWPWVAQLGQDRGGFYSYDVLENLVGCDMPTSDYLRPEKQSWEVGDKLWMYPSKESEGIGFATLRAYVPGRALGFVARALGTPASAEEDGSWSFVLEPIAVSSTRLLVRGRAAAGRSLLGLAFDRSIFEPAHFAMERRMMIGIKQLAEGGHRHRIQNHVQVVLWTIVFVLFATAVVLVLIGRGWRRALLTTVIAGIVFQILTLVQPSLFAGMILTAVVAAVFWWPARSMGDQRQRLVRTA
jgi:hypothetical protein